ncbi:uncharacterized protein LTR77_010431 [Saxophila tyrrhenica]|uniref:SPX domain-containing protein n=1 Tax=Saxophila tyrrhenica TaxID=1690608 RepID=A0AAV9NYT1_9PEZI|nr:hypothetical protein LTR77_010431 [Saxophila tyrrhenica]
MLMSVGTDNIDYDDVKHLIKERTSPGSGKSISIPGQGDEKLVELENTLFAVLADQHERIDLFVRSKAGEIRRRLDHAKKQLIQLSTRRISAAEHRVPIGRLERYGKLENDVLKAGDEIRSLARFTGTQRTAFRKLLKKYKKWTGSSGLEARFRDEVLDDPKSFTKLDLGPLLDEYSVTLQDIRSLYETSLQRAAARKGFKEAPASPGPSSVDRLRGALRNGSRVEFDTAIATVPLGEEGEVANYFVHTENVVELQISLLQYMRYYTSRSRSNSTATPVTPATPRRPSANTEGQDADYSMLVADDQARFAQDQSRLTVNQREHASGAPPQMAKALLHWNEAEDAMVSMRSGAHKTKTAMLKRKQIDSFFDRDGSMPKQAEDKDSDALLAVRKELLKDAAVRPLYKISSCRCRFAGVNDGSQSLTLATLDSSISMQRITNGKPDNEASQLPFAVLQVRKEGSTTNNLLAMLDSSHLVERVRGFSLQYHALWQTCRPKNMSPPFWIPMLSQDIRKLPPPAFKRNGTKAEGGSGSQSATQGTVSTNSIRGLTDSTTAVETSRPSSSVVQTDLSTPPLRSFRKKRRRTYAQRAAEQQKYWSEYDNPSDGENTSDAYVLYIDPNEKSTLDRLLDRLGGFFGRSSAEEEESLLPSPSTPLNDDDTSDEEDTAPAATYGTLPRPLPGWPSQHHNEGPPFLPQVTGICFFASLSILLVAYILATTSKHKFVAEVDVGIIFAVACGLALAVIGCVPVMRREGGSWGSFAVVVAVVTGEVVGSGGLLAWVLG